MVPGAVGAFHQVGLPGTVCPMPHHFQRRFQVGIVKEIGDLPAGIDTGCDLKLMPAQQRAVLLGVQGIRAGLRAVKCHGGGHAVRQHQRPGRPQRPVDVGEQSFLVWNVMHDLDPQDEIIPIGERLARAVSMVDLETPGQSFSRNSAVGNLSLTSGNGVAGPVEVGVPSGELYQIGAKAASEVENALNP